MKALPQLTDLNLDATGVTNGAVEAFRSMTGLKRLNLHHTLITEKGFEELRSALPDCKLILERDSALLKRRGKS